MNTRKPTTNRSDVSEMILSGHLSSAVWQMAWPTVVNTLILNAYNLINALFLSKLPNSQDPLAASAVGGQIMMIQFSLLIGLSAGTGALVSQYLGAGKVEEADGATRQSLLLSAFGGIVSAIPLIVFATPLMRVMGLSQAAVPMAASYTAIISYFSAATFIYMIIVTALRSAGDMKSALYAGAVVTVLNIFLDWLLILGHGPFHAMGIHGAAWATGISRVVGVLLTLWFLRKSVLAGSLSHLKHHDGYARQLLQIGWPAAITNVAWTFASVLYLKVLSTLPGNGAVAAYGVALRIESLAFMPGLAYAQAATPLVGQNLGAGQPDRAAKSAWIATFHGVLIMSAFALIFLIFPRQLAEQFTENSTAADMLPAIVAYLRINAISEPFLAANMILRGALQGAGDTLVPAIFTMFSFYIVRLPLAWILIKLHYGVTGAWLSMCISTILSGVLMMIWFKMGHWRRRTIIKRD